MIDINHLPNQERGEKTILFLRRHWIQVAEIAGFAVALLLIPLVSNILANWIGIDIFSHPFWGPLGSVFLSIYLLLIVFIIQTQFTDYYLDAWIVTSERIINIEQQGLFSRTISELHLNQIQDVTSETHGITATFLSYGDVYIQTAGTRERFNFKGINNPEHVKKSILKLVADDKKRHGDASQLPTMSDAYQESRKVEAHK